MNEIPHVNIIIAPHFDDAVFSLGGLIQKDPENTKVITVFAAAPQRPVRTMWDRVCGFTDSTHAVGERIKENVTALEHLGIKKENIINLSYFDMPYRDTADTKETLRERVAMDIHSLIQKETAQQIRVFAPMMGMHVDHSIARDAVLSISENLYKKEKNTKVQFYLYQDMPYVYLYYKAENTLHPFTSRATILLELFPYELLYKREFIELDTAEYDKKIVACKLYASQFKPLFFGFRSLPKTLRRMSDRQKKIYEIGSDYCELIYKLA